MPGIKEFLQEFTSKKVRGEDGYLTNMGLIELSDKNAKDKRSRVNNLPTLSKD